MYTTPAMPNLNHSARTPQPMYALTKIASNVIMYHFYNRLDQGRATFFQRRQCYNSVRIPWTSQALEVNVGVRLCIASSGASSLSIRGTRYSRFPTALFIY